MIRHTLVAAREDSPLTPARLTRLGHQPAGAARRRASLLSEPVGAHPSRAGSAPEPPLPAQPFHHEDKQRRRVLSPHGGACLRELVGSAWAQPPEGIK